jgi:hypothetical protein
MLESDLTVSWQMSDNVVDALLEPDLIYPGQQGHGPIKQIASVLYIARLELLQAGGKGGQKWPCPPCSCSKFRLTISV